MTNERLREYAVRLLLIDEKVWLAGSGAAVEISKELVGEANA